MNPIKAAWIIMALLGIGLFLLDYSRIRKGRKAIGLVSEQWSLRFNPGLRGNWVALIIILIYWATTGYFFVKSPHSNSNFFLVAVFIIVIGYYYFKWQFICGKRGFIYKTKIYLNEQIIKKDIVVANGKRHLSISYAEDSSGKQTIELMIPIPPKASL